MTGSQAIRGCCQPLQTGNRHQRVSAFVTNTLTLPEGSSIDKFIYVADQTLKIISVFDELRYDRADADLLSVGMRKHAIKKLGQMGFRQTSGMVLQHTESDVRCVIPKFHTLGMSPFDIIRYTPKKTADFYLLTPTQTACQFIDHLPEDVLVERLEQLITVQPINLYRIMDFLEKGNDKHQFFLDALGYLTHVQRKAIENLPLSSMRSLQ